MFLLGDLERSLSFESQQAAQRNGKEAARKCVAISTSSWLFLSRVGASRNNAKLAVAIPPDNQLIKFWSFLMVL